MKPKRGEIWLVEFDPSVGAELTKTRPALVLSRDEVGKLPLRVVVPVTSHQSAFVGVPWMVEINATVKNGLDNKSAADCFQPRSFDLQRFVSRLGKLDAPQVEEIAQTVAAVIGVETTE